MSASIVQISDSHLKEVREIFFETSTRKSFKDEEEKDGFFYKYVGFYLKHYPELCLVSVDDKVLGYVVASEDSRGEELNKIQPHMATFESYTADYPAHLHINLHSESQGKGIGSQLVRKVETLLKSKDIKGLHIMTSPDAANQYFYKKLGFDYSVMENFHGYSILFMGKRL